MFAHPRAVQSLLAAYEGDDEARALIKALVEAGLQAPSIEAAEVERIPTLISWNHARLAICDDALEPPDLVTLREAGWNVILLPMKTEDVVHAVRRHLADKA